MAKISAYGAITAPQSNDLLLTVDVNDTSMAPTGTDKKMTLSQLDGNTQAWQFNVMSSTYGAKGDGKVILDATVSSGALTTLTSATANFTSADTGKSIILSQAGGAATTPLAATITFVNATTVTLSTAVSAGGVTTVGAIYGTDDTAAIQAAINAATTYAQGSQEQYAEVIFPSAYYCIAGAKVTGGSLQGNAQITLPIITASSGQKVNLALKGLAKISAAPEHWLNPNVSAPGAVLVCMRTDGTYSATYGPSSVIGGPVNGYGGGAGTYSNMFLIIEALTILVSFNTTYGGINLHGVGQADVRSYGYMPMAVPAAEAGVWPNGAGTIAGGNQYTAGLIMPVIGNNDICQVGDYTSYSAYIHLCGNDHLTVKNLRTIFGNIGWLPNTGGTGGNNHGASFLNWSCEAVTTPISALASATWSGYVTSNNCPVNIAALDLENYNSVIASASTAGINGCLQGVVWFEDLNGPGNYYGSLQTNCLNLKLLDMTQTVGPVASPHAAPATTVAWGNYYYRDAWITVSLSGGNTFTSLNIDATAQPNAAGASTYQFLLPSGHTYTPTYSAGTLTHTVTLL
jgi:hypothetical protein